MDDQGYYDLGCYGAIGKQIWFDDMVDVADANFTRTLKVAGEIDE